MNNLKPKTNTDATLFTLLHEQKQRFERVQKVRQFIPWDVLCTS